MLKLFVMVPFLAVLIHFSYGQSSTIYVGSNMGYSILINGVYENKSQKLEGATLDALTIRGADALFKYALTIVHSATDEAYSDVLSLEYESSYIENCSCDILTKNEMDFTNVKGLVYQIQKKEGNREFLGYSFNTIDKGVLFNIVFIATPGNYIRYWREFETSLNSFEINEN